MTLSKKALLAFAASAEFTPPKNQRKFLIEVFNTIWPDDGSGPSGEFFRFLDAGAYENAAMMLVDPEWHRIDEQQTREGSWCSVMLMVEGFSPTGEGRASTQALARVAAAFRAAAMAKQFRARKPENIA